jgi:branched-subunit amino acid aminotransferase/4-amino-4-deoxychorismate lyase
LLQADEIFLTGSVQEIVPVAQLEGRPIPRHDLGAKLHEAYGRAVTRILG